MKNQIDRQITEQEDLLLKQTKRRKIYEKCTSKQMEGNIYKKINRQINGKEDKQIRRQIDIKRPSGNYFLALN